MPLTISIVTPSYNQGEFIEETILSVISQEGDFSIDYIVVDGGSADKSLEIIKKYASLLEKGEWAVKCRGIAFRWISEKDNGQADAINKGFLLAKGEVLAWLNSDDTYLEGTLSRVAAQFKGHPEADMVYGKARFTDEHGTIIGKYPTGPFNYRTLATFNFICQPAAFFRKEALSNAGGLDTGLRYVMDYDLWIRMAGKCSLLYYPEFLSTYRLHAESKTMAPGDAVSNHEECLKTVLRHYSWAPFNRVYGYCYHVILYRGPASLTKVRLVAVLLSLGFSIFKYLKLNKRIRLDDLKLITPGNIRKLFKNWIDIYKEY